MSRPHVSLVSILLLGSLGACSAGMSPDTPRPAPRPTPVSTTPDATTSSSEILTYKPFSPPVQISIRRRDSIIVSLSNAGDQVQVRGETAFFTVGTQPIGRSGPHLLEMTLDSVRTEGGDQADGPTATVGVRWSGDRTDRGTLQELVPTRGGAGVARIGHLVSLLFPTLPEGGAAVGSTWKDTRRRVVHAIPFDVRDSLVANYRADSMVTMAGMEWLHVTEETFYTREGSASNSAGASLPVSGFGISSMSYSLSMDGRLVRVDGVDSASMTITSPETGDRFPVRMITRISISPLP